MTKNKKKSKEEIHSTNYQSIPYEKMYTNGILEVRKGIFSKSYRIPAINFKTSGDAEQGRIADMWTQFLDSFEAGVEIQVTLYNKSINMEEFMDTVFIAENGDQYDRYRKEYNDMIKSKISATKNNLETEKILTISTSGTDVFDAMERFVQIDANVSECIGLLTKQSVSPMTAKERLELIYSIYHMDQEGTLYNTKTIEGHQVEAFSLENCEKQGISSKHVIAPSVMEFSKSSIQLGNFYAKPYFIANYPTWIKGTLLTDFAGLGCNMLTTVTFTPMDQSEALKMVRRQNTNISQELVEHQKTAARKGYDASLIAPTTTQAKEETEGILESMTKDNVKQYTANFVITLFAPDEDTLKNSCEKQLMTIANKNLLLVRPFSTVQSEDAFATSLPIGNNKVLNQRLISSVTVGCIIPFDVKEMMQKNGMYYGLNAVSHNLILYNRGNDRVNPNGCILGMPGAGKSFAAKREMINVLLNTNDEVYIIDPEREYKPIVEKLGGSVVKIANGSTSYINPFDMNIDNADDGGDPVRIKSDFIEAICEIMIGGRYGLSPIEKTIIGKSVINIYGPYVEYLKKTGKKYDVKKAPTMLDFYNDLAQQPYAEAANMALSLERYVKGSLDIFSHSTNVEVDNRFTVYDIKDIGAGLKEMGLHICLDNIWNKMISNSYKGKRTWFYIDEFYLMMQKQSSASYISQIFKRARKWNGVVCAITQNVEDMLKSEEARTVINNCSFVMLLGQSDMNRKQLSSMLGISREEQKYISSPKPGMGLIRVNGDVIPMNDDFPKDTELYKIMTTRPEERL